MPTATGQFQLFLSCDLVRTCLRTHIGGGRQLSRNICTMVNLFDKAVAEGAY